MKNVGFSLGGCFLTRVFILFLFFFILCSCILFLQEHEGTRRQQQEELVAIWEQTRTKKASLKVSSMEPQVIYFFFSSFCSSILPYFFHRLNSRNKSLPSNLN